MANLAGKQVKHDDSSNGKPRNENYVHVRAKRGQATNSHSLAERVHNSQSPSLLVSLITPDQYVIIRRLDFFNKLNA